MIKRKSTKVKTSIFFTLGSLLGIFILVLGMVVRFSQTYQDRVYPGIFVNQIDLSGKTPEEVQGLFTADNQSLDQVHLTMSFENHTATVAGTLLGAGINGELAMTQGYSIGRTANFLSDTFFKMRSLVFELTRSHNPVVILPSVVTYNHAAIDDAFNMLIPLAAVEPIEPLFELNKTTNKVINFRLARDGRAVDRQLAMKRIQTAIEARVFDQTTANTIVIELPTFVVLPKVRFNEGANLGIQTLLGRGESFYQGSIKERIHNLSLAASIIHGKLIAPGEAFSFNDAVGDISAATGYKSAYIIKNGRTILGDGGGVCQVSTTLFRAALASGLPIVERAAHSYRVHYYEEGGYKPGLDATVFGPTTDFKFTNDTPAYILIQLTNQPELNKLTFELFGTSDGRTAEIGNFKLWSQSPPPNALYQDDPTLRLGVVKQVDWPAWGAKASFDYKVTKNGQPVIEKTFYSNFLPWQAVYLKGTKVN